MDVLSYSEIEDLVERMLNSLEAGRGTELRRSNPDAFQAEVKERLELAISRGSIRLIQDTSGTNRYQLWPITLPALSRRN